MVARTVRQTKVFALWCDEIVIGIVTEFASSDNLILVSQRKLSYGKSSVSRRRSRPIVADQ